MIGITSLVVSTTAVFCQPLLKLLPNVWGEIRAKFGKVGEKILLQSNKRALRLLLWSKFCFPD